MLEECLVIEYRSGQNLRTGQGGMTRGTISLSETMDSSGERLLL